MANLTLQMFGPMEVLIGDRTLPRLRSRKGLLALALLALRQGKEVEREWLAGTLWPESSESQPLANLRLTLNDLRHALNDEAARLRSPSIHTLSLDLAGADVDLLAFDAALTRGDTRSLEEAIGLYRGPLLEGCAEDWATLERLRREQEYIAALETLAVRALERDELAEATRLLRRVIAADPLREESYRALMQALADSGNFAAAAVVYRDLRLRLRREVNAAPDPLTVELFAQVQSLARSHTVKSLPAASVGVSSPIGYIPYPLSDLVGRARDVEEIAGCLEHSRLVTLAGTGGVGKTRLAIQVSQDQLPRFSDGVWFIELEALADPALLAYKVATSFGLHPEPHQTPEELLIAALSHRRLMLVLDNCEHLIFACAALAATLLARCSQVTLLATSREPLGIAGERVWPSSLARTSGRRRAVSAARNGGSRRPEADGETSSNSGAHLPGT